MSRPHLQTFWRERGEDGFYADVDLWGEVGAYRYRDRWYLGRPDHLLFCNPCLVDNSSRDARTQLGLQDHDGHRHWRISAEPEPIDQTRRLLPLQRADWKTRPQGKHFGVPFGLDAKASVRHASGIGVRASRQAPFLSPLRFAFGALRLCSINVHDGVHLQHRQIVFACLGVPTLDAGGILGVPRTDT